MHHKDLDVEVMGENEVGQKDKGEGREKG